MNILTIGVLAVLVLFGISGLKKGMVRKLAGIAALLLSAFLVSAALPYITDFLKNETPVYSFLTVQCENVISGQISSALKKGTQTKDGSIDRDKVKSMMEQYGMDSSMVDGLSDEELLAVAEQYLGDYEQYLDQYLVQDTEGESGPSLFSMTKIEQTKLIQNLPVPKFLRDLMLEYNNSEGYRKLEAQNFAEYLTHFFADIILNIVAFIVTLIVVQMILWSVMTALNLFTRLPVLHLLNKVGGLAIGIFQGFLAVWVIFLVISALSATEAGMALMEMINDSSILRAIYDSNLFLKLITQAIAGFM
ncbi:MAG: CvpA family protein [Lachnospiraceae bacterium]|nr:CvpA family protein [Lachnospiraceae bacterium]